MRASFQGHVVTLEIARGHDGWFRGPPDPALIIAVYACVGFQAHMIGRTLHRFKPRPPFPSSITPEISAIPSASIDAASSFRFVLLAIALEEDGGKDIQRMFGAVEHHRRLAIWTLDQHEVDPVTIGSVGGNPWSAPLAIDLLFDGSPLSTSCSSDKWIGASGFALPAREGAPQSIYRLPFLAPDRRNDWTAVLSVAH